MSQPPAHRDAHAGPETERGWALPPSEPTTALPDEAFAPISVDDETLPVVEIASRGASGPPPLPAPASPPDVRGGTPAASGSLAARRYRRLGLLGEGGIGTVSIALDQVMGREIALKSLKDAGAAPSTERRFIEEARLTGQLEHPGIVPVYDLGRDPRGAAYYTMPRIHGQTLHDALRGADLPTRLRLLPRLLDVCQAMAYAHARGVIHRDLKPANVMLGAFGQTLVLDWGLAKALAVADSAAAPAAAPDPAAPAATVREESLRPTPARDAALQTVDGAIVGTPAYMAPEQARGDLQRVDRRADVWALGVMLYELLTGSLPFTGRTPWEIVSKVLEQPVAPPHEVEPRAPRELSAIAMRCLERDVALRYPDAAALVRDLEAFTEGRLVAAHRYGGRELAWRWLRRRAVPIAALTLLLGATSGTALVTSMRAAAAAREAAARLDARALQEADQTFIDARAPRDEDWLDVKVARLIARQRPALQPRLRAALADAAPTARRIAARVLGATGGADALPALLARLEPGAEADERVLIDVIRALGALDDARASKAVDTARHRHGQFSLVWTATTRAFQNIPPADLPPAQLASADAWVDRGNELLSKAMLAEAFAHYDRALQLDPRSARAYTNRGMAARRAGHLRRAEADHDAALAIAPLLPAALANRAVVRRLRHHLQGAEADLTTLLERTGALHPLALRGRARVRDQRGDTDGARADLDRALAMAPRDVLVHWSVGVHALATGDLPAARAAFDRGLALDPRDALLHRWRAEALAQAGAVEAARVALDEALAYDPKVERGLAARAGLLVRLGQPGAAGADLLTQLQREDGSAEALLDRALLLHVATGAWSAAAADLDAAAAVTTPAVALTISLLRAALARHRGAPAALPAGDGEVPLYDALLAAAAGRADLGAAVARLDEPTTACFLAVALHVAGRAAALPPRATWPAPARRAPELADGLCAAAQALLPALATAATPPAAAAALPSAATAAAAGSAPVLADPPGQSYRRGGADAAAGREE